MRIASIKLYIRVIQCIIAFKKYNYQQETRKTRKEKRMDALYKVIDCCMTEVSNVLCLITFFLCTEKIPVKLALDIK